MLMTYMTCMWRLENSFWEHNIKANERYSLFATPGCNIQNKLLITISKAWRGSTQGFTFGEYFGKYICYVFLT